MPQLARSQSRLPRFFKWALISFVLVAGIWAGVILWWQSSQRQITPQDVLFYLVVLPATVLLGLAAVRWLRTRKQENTAGPRSITADGANASPPAAPGDTGALPVLAAWSLTSAGASLDALRIALIAKKHRPRPDAALLGDYGYPLHASRITQIDTGAVQEALQVIAGHHACRPAPAEPDREAFLRTLALLSQLFKTLGADWPLAAATPGSTDPALGRATLRGSEPAGDQSETGLQLLVKLITPADLSPVEQAQALSYALEKTADLPIDPRQLHLEALAAGDDATVLRLAERFRSECLHAVQPQALLLLASESTLCPTVVERWQAEQKLFSSQVPQGLMAGEAAFAILCINHAAMPLALTAPACSLRRVFFSMREASADSAGKPSHATLDAVIGDALAAAELDGGDAIGDVACDADHRSSRVLECIGAMLRHTPQLDAIANRLAVNEACGHTGAASSAGGWVAGIAQARDAGHPVLVFNVSHAFERAAAVLLPTQPDNKFLPSGSP